MHHHHHHNTFRKTQFVDYLSGFLALLKKNCIFPQSPCKKKPFAQVTSLFWFIAARHSFIVGKAGRNSARSLQMILVLPLILVRMFTSTVVSACVKILAPLRGRLFSRFSLWCLFLIWDQKHVTGSFTFLLVVDLKLLLHLSLLAFFYFFLFIVFINIILMALTCV